MLTHLSVPFALLTLLFFCHEHLLPLPCHLFQQLFFERPLAGDGTADCLGLLGLATTLPELLPLLSVVLLDLFDLLVLQDESRQTVGMV
jgi:hypothetical protein